MIIYHNVGFISLTRVSKMFAIFAYVHVYHEYHVTEAVQAVKVHIVLSNIVVVGALTRGELLHSVCDLKATGATLTNSGTCALRVQCGP